MLLSMNVCFIYGQDAASYAALENDYKKLKRVLETRAAIEHANELLHKYSKEATVEYKNINESLDKWTKCFDVIDVIFNSGMTVLNFYHTYDNTKDKISDLSSLITDFANNYTLEGNIVSSDTMIVNSCRRAVTAIYDDGEEIFMSCKDLALYASGKVHCTTAKFMIILNRINTSLDDIRRIVDHTYYVIWKYITIRTHYFKASLYRSKNLREMANDAFSRWKLATETVGY